MAGLRALDAFASHGSMVAAAGALGYTPSAVSQQIAKLSREVRQVLVEQRGRGVALTSAGRVLAESARRVVVELDSVQAELQARAGTVSGSLRLAAFPSAARGLVPAALRSLCDQWPGLAVTLVEADSHRAVELVAGGVVDLCVAHDWRDLPLVLPDGLRARHLGDDVSDVLVHRGHRLAGSCGVPLASLADDSWLYEPGSVAHDFLRGVLGAGARFTHQVGEYATQIEMVGAGMGVALVPRMGRGPLPPTVRSIAVSDGPVRRVYGVWRALVGRRPAVGAALAVLGGLCP